MFNDNVVILLNFNWPNLLSKTNCKVKFMFYMVFIFGAYFAFYMTDDACNKTKRKGTCIPMKT